MQAHFRKPIHSFAALLNAVLAIRLLGAIVMIIAPITAPHTWRQVDTMSTALRYARRWTVEQTDFSWWIPAVLNSRDTRGIMAMEFPIVDMLGALGFVVSGNNVDLGRSVAQGLILAAVAALIFQVGRAWRGLDKELEGIEQCVMLSACCSFATPFTAKFMPDTIAMLLALVGTAALWRLRWSGVFWIALGLMIKPTAGVCVALLMLHPQSMKAWIKQIPMVIIALIPALVWYVNVTKFLEEQQELPALFALFADRNAVDWFQRFWSSAGIWDLFNFHVVFQFGWILLVAAVIVTKDSRRRLMMLKLFGVALVQASLIGILSGDHAKFHAYYLIGLAPTFALLIYHSWVALRWPVARALLVFGILIRSGEAAVADMGGMWSAKEGSSWFRECKSLRERVPDAPWNQGLVWRTPLEDYPLIDLCIGERGQGSAGEWGVFRLENEVPAGCSDVAKTLRLRLVRCH